MENPKAAGLLTDTASPHHVGSKQFAALPLPDVHTLQQKQMQLASGSKVSCCTRGADPPCGPQLHFGGGSGGSGLLHPSTVLDAQGAGTVTCQVGSGFYRSASTLKNVPARSGAAGLASDFSSLCLENSVPSCPRLPCCGKLHFQSCPSSLHKLHPFPPHPNCTTSGYFPCPEFTSGAPGLLEEHLVQSERAPCVCTNSLHLKVAPSVCLKSPHYCSECLSKVCTGFLFLFCMCAVLVNAPDLGLGGG